MGVLRRRRGGEFSCVERVGGELIVVFEDLRGKRVCVVRSV